MFERLLIHVRNGYGMGCFPEASGKLIEDMIREYPGEWCREELEHALREGNVFWEDIGRRQAMGECLGNSRSWYYNMANKYGWREKVEVEAEHKGSVQVNIVSYASSKPSTTESKGEVS